MESQPQNPEFRIDPENFHPCVGNTGTMPYLWWFHIQHFSDTPLHDEEMWVVHV